MDYINIISKEAIEILPNWILFIILGTVLALIIIPTAIVWVVVNKKKQSLMRVVYTELISGAIAIILFYLFISIFAGNFLVPSGRYRYKATVDKEHITVEQYEEFIEKYNPTIQDGIYYWEE